MSDASSRKILVLGSRWSGKSVLIKCLDEICSLQKTANDEFFHTTPTVGKMITEIKYKRNQTFQLHEVGAQLSCVWDKYYVGNQFDKMIYVIDLRQPRTISFNSERLKEISEQTTIKPNNILLVFNKANEISSLSKTALIELLDLDSLWNEGIQIIETNTRTRMNISTLLDWLAR